MQREHPLNILQVNTYDKFGGAARIVWTLHNGFRARGHKAWVVVSAKSSQDTHVQIMPLAAFEYLGKTHDNAEGHLAPSNGRNRSGIIGKFLQRAFRKSSRLWDEFWGIENFDYPGSWRLLETTGEQIDLIHLHNLHGNYFDLRVLPDLTHERPTILTLHDAWLLSGHCAHSFNCDRWEIGCGHCPYLGTNPPVKRDSTAYNWRRKKEIYQNSQVYIASPSQWLLDKVNKSILSVAVRKSRVIHNGIDLSVFYPMEKTRARDILQLPQEAILCLFVATGPQDNVFKDYKTIIEALKIVANRWKDRRVIFIALGGDDGISNIGNTQIISVPFERDPEMVAKYYQAADIYLHAARADTFPTVILEALACGMPVIATGIGGIPEQISDGQTGFIIPGEAPEIMACRIIELLKSDDLREQMGLNAAKTAKAIFSLDRMVEDYLSYYTEVIDDWQSRK